MKQNDEVYKAGHFEMENVIALHANRLAWLTYVTEISIDFLIKLMKN